MYPGPFATVQAAPSSTLPVANANLAGTLAVESPDLGRVTLTWPYGFTLSATNRLCLSLTADQAQQLLDDLFFATRQAKGKDRP